MTQQTNTTDLKHLQYKMQLNKWRWNRTKNFARKTNRTIEETLLYIRQRCGRATLDVAVDDLIAEMDSVVDAAWHSNNEPVFIHSS